ncbi:putative toxin-antitoxin system toxin component, PIN family [Candidatus Amesbacteria bacterium]|nr:putative toxin-antitoxin system toxin component, PIN family [Candidatus Amesbacteria bacterium]
MVKSGTRVVLDTNVLISAIVFGGKSRSVLKLLLKDKIVGVTSGVLLAELSEVIHKKFPFKKSDLEYIEEQIRTDFELVNPRIEIKIARDDDDNRVLEAAVEGDCEYIVTGDEDLLIFKKYKTIKIMTPAEFLNE